MRHNEYFTLVFLGQQQNSRQNFWALLARGDNNIRGTDKLSHKATNDNSLVASIPCQWTRPPQNLIETEVQATKRKKGRTLEMWQWLSCTILYAMRRLIVETRPGLSWRWTGFIRVPFVSLLCNINETSLKRHLWSDNQELLSLSCEALSGLLLALIVERTLVKLLGALEGIWDHFKLFV